MWWLVLVAKFTPFIIKTSERDFLDWIIPCGKAHPKSGPYFLVVAHTKEHERRKLWFCPLTLLFNGKSIYSVVEAFSQLTLQPTSSEIHSRPKINSSVQIPGILASDWDCRHIQSLELNNYQIICLPFRRLALLDYPPHDLKSTLISHLWMHISPLVMLLWSVLTDTSFNRWA